MSTGPVVDKPKKAKRPKNKPSITDANKPVIDALRDNLQNKIWICKDDTLEVDRKPLVGFVSTPGEGVSVEEHTQVLLSAINSMLSGNSDADTVIDAIMDIKADSDSAFYFKHPDLSDRNMWIEVENFGIPESFFKRLQDMYNQDSRTVSAWVWDYKKFMYIKSIHPTAVPSDNIAKVMRLHLQYTESYGALCGILEGMIAYEPLDEVSLPLQATLYERTRKWYYSEFGTTPSETAWNGKETLTIDKCVDPRKFWIVKKFWK